MGTAITMTLSELARAAMTPKHTHGHATPVKVTRDSGFEGATGEFERVQSDIIPTQVYVALYRPGGVQPIAIVPVTASVIHEYIPASGYGPSFVDAQLPEFVLVATLPEPPVEECFLGPVEFVPHSPKPTPPKPASLFDGVTGRTTTTAGWKESPLPGSAERTGAPLIIPGGAWTPPAVPTPQELET